MTTRCSRIVARLAGMCWLTGGVLAVRVCVYGRVRVAWFERLQCGFYLAVDSAAVGWAAAGWVVAATAAARAAAAAAAAAAG